MNLNHSQSKEIVVIGAGPGGLAAAMLLSKQNYNVTLLEKNPFVGGRTSTLQLGDFTFDRGPTFLQYPEPLEIIFEAAGHSLFEEIDLKRLDPMYRIAFENDRDLLVSENKEQLKREIARFNPHDAFNVDRFLSDHQKKFDAFRPIFQNHFESVGHLFRWQNLQALPWLKPHLFLDDELSNYFKDPRVRLAFGFQSKYLGMSPFQCPSLFTILSFLEHNYGVYHPIGGLNAITRKMAEILENLGTKILLNQTVETICFDGQRAKGVMANGHFFPADAVVMNADFAQAAHDLIPESLRPRWNNQRIQNSKYSCSTFMLYLGVNKTFDSLPHHNILLSENYQENLKQMEEGILPSQPSLYVQNASKTDPTLAPSGCSSIYILVPVPAGLSRSFWESHRGDYRQKILDRVKTLGIDIQKHDIVEEQMVTPIEWTHTFSLFKGSTFSFQHSLDQLLFMRPHNRFQNTKGLYIVGGGTHPGSGLPPIFQSAIIGTNLLASDLEKPKTSWFTLKPN